MAKKGTEPEMTMNVDDCADCLQAKLLNKHEKRLDKAEVDIRQSIDDRAEIHTQLEVTITKLENLSEMLKKFLESDTYKQRFWRSFVSGISSGIVVGVIVALILRLT